MTPAGHVIRLAGVWEIARATPPSLPVHWTRVRLDRLPSAGLPFAPGAYRRGFGRPTNLALDQAVSLELVDLRLAAEIRFNGAMLARVAGPVAFARWRIEDRLADRNELVLLPAEGPPRDESAASSVWPFAECRLVIEER